MERGRELREQAHRLSFLFLAVTPKAKLSPWAVHHPADIQKNVIYTHKWKLSRCFLCYFLCAGARLPGCRYPWAIVLLHQQAGWQSTCRSPPCVSPCLSSTALCTPGALSLHTAVDMGLDQDGHGFLGGEAVLWWYG